MSDQDGWRVATSPTEWVTVKTADEAVRLGQMLAALAAENERLQGNLAGRDAMIMGRDSIIKCRKDEIERLVTAGDGIAEILRNIDHSSAFIAAWNEAKATLGK